jgi:hypothetical protein
MFRCGRLLLLTSLAALAFAGPAHAAGGNYVFDSGTPQEQAQVRAALNVSSFDWSLVAAQITIHIGAFGNDQAKRGEIFLNATDLDTGVQSWGIVQHEYAHQVDFFLLTDSMRAQLQTALGARDWCYTILGLPHFEYGCERFASTLAWSYWPSQRNCLRPPFDGGESTAMPPAKFRALLARLIGARTTQSRH